MANYIGKFVVRKILKESSENKFGKSDAFFERTPATRMGHSGPTKFTGNKKRLRKALPPGLSESDQEVLVRVKRRAYMLDMSLFSLCGLRFGWSSVIGLLPGIGDVCDMLLALMVVRSASEVGLPPAIRTKMLFNIILDFLIGLVPFLGDLADAAYKCNTRNAIILENYLRERGQGNIRKSGAVPPPDMSLPEEYEQQPELYGSTAQYQQQQQQQQSAPPPMREAGYQADLEAQKYQFSSSKIGNSKSKSQRKMEHPSTAGRGSSKAGRSSSKK